MPNPPKSPCVEFQREQARLARERAQNPQHSPAVREQYEAVAAEYEVVADGLEAMPPDELEKLEKTADELGRKTGRRC